MKSIKLNYKIIGTIIEYLRIMRRSLIIQISLLMFKIKVISVVCFYVQMYI